jgi:hypothetical protein
LGIEVRRVNEILEFLIKAQILEQNRKGELKIGKSQIHLGADSSLIVRHHLNWRLQSMLAIEKKSSGRSALFFCYFNFKKRFSFYSPAIDRHLKRD